MWTQNKDRYGTGRVCVCVCIPESYCCWQHAHHSDRRVQTKSDINEKEHCRYDYEAVRYKHARPFRTHLVGRERKGGWKRRRERRRERRKSRKGEGGRERRREGEESRERWWGRGRKEGRGKGRRKEREVRERRREGEERVTAEENQQSR